MSVASPNSSKESAPSVAKNPKAKALAAALKRRMGKLTPEQRKKVKDRLKALNTKVS